jgi:hypothetical protein
MLPLSLFAYAGTDAKEFLTPAVHHMASAKGAVLGSRWKNLHLKFGLIVYTSERHHAMPGLFEITERLCQLFYGAAWACQNTIYFQNVI